jgi:hypothetical protein
MSLVWAVVQQISPYARGGGLYSGGEACIRVGLYSEVYGMLIVSF